MISALVEASDLGSVRMVGNSVAPFRGSSATDSVRIRRHPGTIDPLFIEQEKLPRPDLLRAELIGRLVEVLGKLGDRADVARHRCRSVVANAKILQHSLSECGHR